MERPVVGEAMMSLVLGDIGLHETDLLALHDQLAELLELVRRLEYQRNTEPMLTFSPTRAVRR